MKMNSFITLSFLILLSPCTGQQIETLETLTSKLKEITLPTPIEIQREDNPIGIELTERQIKELAPIDCEDQSCQVFAFNTIKKDQLTGVFYLYKYEQEDPEDYQELSHAIYLTIYDVNGKINDHLLLATIDYGTGTTYFKSWNEIIYLFHSEMESIHLVKTTYSLEGNKFIKGSEEEKLFNSDEQGYDEYLNHIQKIIK